MDLNDDRIDDYILGRLDENGKKAFAEEMDKDDYLRADTTLTADIADALGRREEKVMKMQKWERERERERSVRNRIRKTVIWSGAVAACVSLLLVAGWPYTYYGLQDRDFLASRGGTSFESLWESKDYDGALSSIEESILSAEEDMSLLTSKDELTAQEAYRLEYLKLTHYELRWAKIQTLLKMRDYASAYDETAVFVKED
ncbi:MAG: hypothetical protein ACI3ZN_05020, partial [Candidatus Cryptobacteroides sp.]